MNPQLAEIVRIWAPALALVLAIVGTVFTTRAVMRRFVRSRQRQPDNTIYIIRSSKIMPGDVLVHEGQRLLVIGRTENTVTVEPVQEEHQ